VLNEENEGVIEVEVSGGNVLVDTTGAEIGDSAVATITNGYRRYAVTITVTE